MPKSSRSDQFAADAARQVRVLYRRITLFAAADFMTLVGGTQSASLTGVNPACTVETTWNDQTPNSSSAGLSSGGVCPAVPIPSWQPAALMSTNNGSTSSRNLPDVAAMADGIFLVLNGAMGSESVGGTSAAAPLWAALTALINQARTTASPSLGPMGFANPLIYAIGQSNNYASSFFDVTDWT